MHQLAKKLRTTGRIRHLVDRACGPAITALLSVAVMAQALTVWRWRPGDPVGLSGDSPSFLTGLKGMLEHGWNGSNLDLGAPFHQDASWFPHADQLHLFLTGRVIGLFSDNPFTVSAVYFFLGFPLAALSMYWLARQRHLGRAGAVVAGVLFSVLPGHQTMFEHLWLASYWVVPLGIWLVLRAAQGEPLLKLRVAWRDPAQRRPALALNLTTVFCVVCIATGGIYYSAFTLLLLAVALLGRLVATRDRAAVARAALLPVAIGSLSLAAVLSITAGQDASTLVNMPGLRGFEQSEQAAGKLMDLILPWVDHRAGALRLLSEVYNSRTTATLEHPALGVIALAGATALVVIMLSTLVSGRVKPVHPELLVLGGLTVVALAFYSIGGLGSFVALFVTPQIRTWSRLFIFIGLFGLLAVGHWLTVLTRRDRAVGLITAAALLVIGTLDQTSPAVAPDYQSLRAELAGLRTFSQGIEARVEPGCAVFQLPVAVFPEQPPVHDMADYAHLRPYLASSSLRWSYGAYGGTSLADWQLALPQEPTTALVDDLVAAGFCVVEIDRAGFADRGTASEARLRKLLGAPISATPDNRLLAWDLTPQGASPTARPGLPGPKASTSNGEAVTHPVLVYSDKGTYPVEHAAGTPYQWTLATFELDVHNFGRAAVDGVRLTFSLAAPDLAPRSFTVQLPDASVRKVTVNGGAAREVQVVVNAKPGRNAVTITTTGKPVSGPSVDGANVFGKLVNLRAHLADRNARSGVVQQRPG